MLAGNSRARDIMGIYIMQASIRTIATVLALIAAQPALAKDEPLKVSTPAAVKGAEQVVIGAFNVGFIFQSVDQTASTGGMIGAFGGATRAKSELVGVSPDMMQAITDAAYEDMRGQLSARGFTVTDPAALFASPELAKIKPMTAPYEAKVQIDKKSQGKTSYYKPTALPGQLLMPGDVAQGGFGAIGMNMASGQTAAAFASYAKANKIAVVDVVYLIDFSDAKRPGAFSFGGLQVNSGMSVAAEFSKVSVVGPSGKVATVFIKQPVAVEGDFVKKQDNTKDGALQSAANVAGGVAAVFGMGGMKFGKSKTFTFTANDQYTTGAIKATTLTNERVAAQLGALR